MNGLRKTNVDHYFTIFGRRTVPLRWHLVLLVVGTLLPVVVFAMIVVNRLSTQEQAAAERRALLAARNLAGTVEGEVSSTIRTLQALAASQNLEQENLSQFYNQARRVAQTQPTWLTVLLLTPDGRQLVNTRQPFGTPSPEVSEPESLRRVVETGQPTVGDLARGQRGGNLAFPVRVPVLRDDEVEYILTAVITPQALAEVVEQQTSIDGEWTRTIVDGEGFVVARTRNPERFVGQQGTPSFLRRIVQTEEGVYRDTTLEGEQVYVAFKRSGSRWTAAVTVPVRVIQGPTQQAMWIVTGSGLALLLVSGLGAIVLSRQISRSITSAAEAATALARGEHPQVSPSFIEEVDSLGEALEFSADLLLQREQERTENLARAEAAREEAEAANRIKDEFLAVLSHELRSPLNPILGWCGLFRTGRLDAEKTAQAIETIERNAKLQTQLIEDLLDVSRILQGKLSLSMMPINLALTIEAALETVRLAAEAKAIDLQFILAAAPELAEDSESTVSPGSLPPVPPAEIRVLGDSARLQQVVWNLLSNAVKFTPEKGKVTIHLGQVGSHAQIQVIDNGKGIPPKFLPHVFDYFRQADATTTRRFGGLGLGLAIVRHLVELHGGTVQADSAGENQGATFTVMLPLLKAKHPGRKVIVPPLSPLSSSRPALQNVRILLIDDETDARDVATFTLQEAGAIVTATESPLKALTLFAQSLPDVIVSDVGMPEMDGYTLIQRIRAMPAQQGGQIPAIALTAYAGEINQKQAKTAGFHHHLAKPVDPDELIRTVIMLTQTKNEEMK